MKKLKKIALLSLFSIIALASFTKVSAAYAKISSNKSSMYVGDTATISISANAAAWNLHVSGATSWSAADSTSDGENASKSFPISFKPSKEGTYSIKLSGDVTDGKTMNTSNVSGSVTIKVNNKSNNNNSSNNNENSSNNTKPTVSSDATLKNLGIKPHDFSGFKKANTYYSVTVPNDTDKISIYGYASNSNASVSGTGTKSLSVGKNTFSVKVTAEDKKTTKTYTIAITRKEKSDSDEKNEEDKKEELSTDATLSNFGISPKEYDFSGFKKSNTSYSTTVPSEVERISIYGYASNAKATIDGTGTKTLDFGKNEFNIKVTAEDKKTTKTYTVTITREEEKEKADEKEEEEETEEKTDTSKKENGISDIKVNGYSIYPKFDPDVHEYNVNIPENVKNVTVDIDNNDKNLETEVAVDSNLKIGTNLINIIVNNKKTGSTENYQIRASIGEEKVDVTKFNTEVKQAQAGLKHKSNITKGTIILIIFMSIVFIVSRHKIKENMAWEEEGDEYEDSEEIENPYSLYNNIEENEEKYDDEGLSKYKRKPKGKRFK